MQLDPISVGPWLEGQDTFHTDLTHAVFQPGESGARLSALTNLDLTDEGTARLRAGLTSRVAATTGLNTFSGAGLLLLQDAGVIKSVNTTDWTTSSVVTGLNASARVDFHEHDNQIWWTNGLVNGRILADESTEGWGIAVPPTPTLGTTAGDLPAGLYQVAATYLDGAGVESGAGKAASIVLDGTEDITATLTPDADAVSVRFYATEADVKGEGGLFWVKTVAVGSLPATIDDVKVSRYALKTQHMRGPVAGDGVFSYQEILGTWKDNWIYPSSGMSPHLFRLGHDIIKMPFDVQAVAGTEQGFYAATTKGLFFLVGDTIRNLQRVRKDSYGYATGSTVVSGDRIPRLESGDTPVALFVNEFGLVAGLPGGKVVQIPQDQLRISSVTSKRASIAYCERGDLRQVLFSVE